MSGVCVWMDTLHLVIVTIMIAHSESDIMEVMMLYYNKTEYLFYKRLAGTHGTEFWGKPSLYLGSV